jgi:hypothetical protein
MKQIASPLILCLVLGVTPAPVSAQDTQSDTKEGLSLMERGMKLLFEGLLSEMEPALGEMAEAMKQLEPMARDLAEMIGDVRNYEAPEQLPNGDIIIRRKPGAPPPKLLPKPEPEGQIEI